MKIFNILLFGVLLAGCSSTVDTLKPTSVKEVIVEKKVIVKCELPKINCEFKGEGFIPTTKLLDCLKLHKEAIRICTETDVTDEEVNDVAKGRKEFIEEIE